MLDFQGVAAEIVQRNPGLVPCLPAIEKELLHLEILGAMRRAGHLRHLTFKGGTCLRLCYGADRFSEDLDFSGGGAFDHALLVDIEGVLRAWIGHRYGLEVSVSPPKPAARGGAKPNRWIARVVTRPAGPGGALAVQRIKIEIDEREPPAEIEYRGVAQRYDVLAGYFAPFPVSAAPLADILADKLIAFPMSALERDNPRYRDVWDMEWIARRVGAIEAVFEAVRPKAAALGLSADRFDRALDITIGRLDAIVESEGFRQTLRRFVPKPAADQTVDDSGYRQYLASETRRLLVRVREVSPGPAPAQA